MTYLAEIMNNINQAAANKSMLAQFDQFLTIANSLLALVVIIIGLNWLKPLKEKQNAASFTFWSQMYIRLIRINSYLKSNNKCFFYWYSPSARAEWQAILAPNPEEISQLRIMVEETLTFLQEANDQMPPYNGWTNDYAKLLGYFADMVVYDICLSDAKFKFNEKTNYNDYLKLHNSICALIDLMCGKVESKQKTIEYRLTVAWYKRLWEWFMNILTHNTKKQQ